MIGGAHCNCASPTLSGTVLRNPPVYICMVHTLPPGPVLQANVTGSMTMNFDFDFDGNNLMYMYVRMKHGKADGSICYFLLVTLSIHI